MTFRMFALRATFVLVIGTALAALWFYRSTFVLAFLAVVVAVLISIPASYLRRLGLPRGVAVAVAVVFVVEAASGIGFLLVRNTTVDNNPGDLVRRLPQIAGQLGKAYNAAAGRGDAVGRLLPPLTLELGRSLTPERLEQTVSDVLSRNLPVLVRSGSFVLTLLANAFLVLILAIFFVAEPKTYVRASLYLVPAPRQLQLLALRTWLSTLLISVTITVVLVLLILGPLGMPYVTEVAVFAGLATFVPNVGALLPAVLIILILLVADPARIPLVVAAYLVIQLLESNVLTPAVVRRQLSIPPAATLLMQIFAGLTFGALGVMLAVPLLALGTVLVREFYSYGVLGLRGQSMPVNFSPSPPHAHFRARGLKLLRRRRSGRK